MSGPELLVCSHRGPYVYNRVRGSLVGRRGGGGLIGAVAPVIERFGGTWVAAAISPADHELARSEPEGREESGFRLRLLDLPKRAHEQHYDIVSNEYLWFLFHYLFDVAAQPVFDSAFERAWEGYREVNRLYAEALSGAGRSDAILVEDYHLLLVGAELRRRRVRRPIVYFHHTPWCEADYFSLLPEALRNEILEAMLAYDVVGLHSPRWARAFLACCDRHLKGAQVSETTVSRRGRSTQVVVAPVPLDVPRLREQSASERTVAWIDQLEEMRLGRRMLVRVDRIDLSKNPLRGYLAFEALLERKPRLAKDVYFLALQYPSRLKVDRYRAYFADCLNVVQRVNERFARRTPGDEGPIGLHFQDDFSRSLAAMRTYDAILVNPVFDGLNLVAKEAAVINERDGAVILSRNAGAFEEIGAATVGVNPFDVTGTADAIERALEMPQAERRRRARKLRTLVEGATPEDWARAQLAAAGVNL